MHPARVGRAVKCILASQCDAACAFISRALSCSLTIMYQSQFRICFKSVLCQAKTTSTYSSTQSGHFIYNILLIQGLALPLLAEQPDFFTAWIYKRVTLVLFNLDPVFPCLCVSE